MHRFLKITATVFLTVLPAAAAMGQQNFRQRDNSGGSSFGQSDGSNGRRSNRFDSGSQQDSSGYNRRDSGSRNNDSGNGPSSFSSRDSSPKDFGSKTASPSDQPMVAPKSSGAFVSKPLPAELVVLTTRSIFSRDHRAVAAASDRPTPVFRSDVAKLIFRGAMLKKPDNHFVAFIEDSAGSRPPQWVGIGQTLTSNGGQIVDITLDNIVVEKGGSVRQIPVGDTLDAGTRLANPPATASLVPGAAAAANAASDSTGNSSAGASRVTGANPSATPAVTASTTGTASDEDVADMMRRRRVQELGQ